MPKRIVLIALAASFTLTSAAAAKRYVLRHPHREYCKAHYARKVERVRRRNHRRIIEVRVTVCVYIKPKSSRHSTTAPASPASIAAPPRTVALHAHLDPSFVQSPTNPLAVTYSYSASATSMNLATGASAPEPSLPEGTLDLYSNGSLGCSINVGGATTGGECPVTYQATGEQKVIVKYTSGTTNATETYAEMIEPYATTTTVRLHESTGGSVEEQKVWEVGATVDGPFATSVNGLLNYTIIDTTTETVEAEFQGSTEYTCTFYEGYSERPTEYKAIGSGTCKLKVFTAHATDTIVVVARFVGSAGFLPSTSDAASL